MITSPATTYPTPKMSPYPRTGSPSAAIKG